MESNLGKIIQQIISTQKNQKLQHVYIVDKETGPYRKIQQAINQAIPGSIIKISEGLYDQLLYIKQLSFNFSKPLTLQPKIYYRNKNGKLNTGVILLISSGHAVTVDLKQGESCYIKGIKISQSGNNITQQYQNEILEHQQILRLFEKKKMKPTALQNEYINKYRIENIKNLILYIKSGKLNIQSSLLSLSYIVKSCKKQIPAIVVEKQGHIFLDKCEIRGNAEHQTIGIISKFGCIQCNNCKITGHKICGIIKWGYTNNNSKIVNNVIEDCKIGINILGQQNNVNITQNTIRKCKIGAKIGLGVKCQINKNFISENDIGIQIHSAFPLITKNRIQKNESEGIYVKSYKKLKCEPVIKKNYSITGNKKNGILIEGLNNTSKIYQNHLIGFNSCSGIRISHEASPHILLNKIYKNLMEGILLIQTSSAIIEKNQISYNIKMNIGLGGQNSSHTMIIENKITNSTGDGIFMVECSKSIISRNDILENNNNIIMISSIPIITRNYISKGKGNGILLIKHSQPIIKENFICENEAMGIFFRDKSYGEIDSNVIDGNQIDVAFQKNDFRSKQIIHSNTISGDIRIPNDFSCNIF